MDSLGSSIIVCLGCIWIGFMIGMAVFSPDRPGVAS